jgi:hypothetical protein
MDRRTFSFKLLPALLLAPACSAARGRLSESTTRLDQRSLATQWLEVALEVTAREVDRTGPRPTVLSRTLAVSMTAMFNAWAAYDDAAKGAQRGTVDQWARFRRPPVERTLKNKERAIGQAMLRALVAMHPSDENFINSQASRLGVQADHTSRDPSSPAGTANLVADILLAERAKDGSNQEHNYADTTGYSPVNTTTEISNPDRWQPIDFIGVNGAKTTPGFLTPHWSKVVPFALERCDKFRPGPPPKVGSAQLLAEVTEVVELNARLSCQEKAIVEFMRDGPRSTGQSGHWLRFAQDVSRRDNYNLDQDVKLYFAIANVAMDAFIAAWDAKIAYDSARPWTLIHYLFAGKQIQAWGGPDLGTITMPGENWHPYSPRSFVTPPFPGYVSGHSCVSAACAETLRLFTGSDTFGKVERRLCGELTGEHLHETTELQLPTFSATAEMAGRSRVLGGYHIHSDNVAGLALGKNVAAAVWPAICRHMSGNETAATPKPA